MKTVRYALAGLAMMAGTAPQALMAAEVQVAAQAPVVSLSVTEEVRSAPDAASFSTGVTTQAPTATEALRQNSAQMSALIERIKKLGVADKDIQTSGINLSAQYDYNNRDNQPQGPRFIGYEASNQLTVKLRDITRVGASLDAMVAAGATNISGPNFSIDDPSPMLVQARGAALKSAKAQADYYAQAAGYRSARLVSISESNSGGQPPMPMMQSARFKADAAPVTPVEPGQVSASVTLTVQYALEK